MDTDSTKKKKNNYMKVCRITPLFSLYLNLLDGCSLLNRESQCLYYIYSLHVIRNLWLTKYMYVFMYIFINTFHCQFTCLRNFVANKVHKCMHWYIYTFHYIGLKINIKTMLLSCFPCCRKHVCHNLHLIFRLLLIYCHKSVILC